MFTRETMVSPKTWSLLLAGVVLVGGVTCWAGRDAVPELSNLPRGERITRLESLIRTARTPQEQAPWRYVLASSLQELGDTNRALSYLDGLDKNYPLLKERVLVKQAQLLGGQAAQKKWQEVADLQGSLQPEALYQLSLTGATDAQQQLLQQFPAHPRTALVLMQLLEVQPSNVTYLKQWVQYFADQPQAVGFAKQLEVLGALDGQTWGTLGQLYYQNKEYQRAIRAFNQAGSTPKILFTLGKSYQAIKQNNGATAVWNRLAREFPQSPEAAQGKLLAVGLLPRDQRTSAYRQVAATFPTLGGTALRQAAKLATGSAQDQLNQEITTRFPQSDEAVDAAWDLAWDWSRQGNLTAARRLGEQALTQFQSDKYATPRLGFWTGRWAEIQGDTQKAKLTYRTVLKRFPASYYSWRSAVHLGLAVGDYQVRELTQPVKVENATNTLPGGSASVRELYRLGLRQEALAQFQAENYLNRDVSPTNRATEATIRAQLGQNLVALKQLLPLAYEESPETQKLHQERAFWEAAYPAAHWDALALWAGQNRVNPLLALALMRQESAFEPAIRSHAGALGLMQLMPGTADGIARKLGVGNYSMTNPSDNIRFGTYYLAQTHDRWADNSLLAVASYNAGPGNVAKWAKSATLSDPEKFVEEIPFRETKGYVKSVFGNYWNYLRIYSPGFQEQVDQLTAGPMLVSQSGRADGL